MFKNLPKSLPINKVQTEIKWVDEVSDGNCFFRAISRILKGTDAQHTEIRQEIADYMQNNEQEYLNELQLRIFDYEEDVNYPKDESYKAKGSLKFKLQNHLKFIRTDLRWAGSMEVLAAEKLYGRKMIIYNLQGQCETPNEKNHSDCNNLIRAHKADQLFVLCHIRLEHYGSGNPQLLSKPPSPKLFESSKVGSLVFKDTLLKSQNLQEIISQGSNNILFKLGYNRVLRISKDGTDDAEKFKQFAYEIVISSKMAASKLAPTLFEAGLATGPSGKYTYMILEEMQSSLGTYIKSLPKTKNNLLTLANDLTILYARMAFEMEIFCYDQKSDNVVVNNKKLYLIDFEKNFCFPNLSDVKDLFQKMQVSVLPKARLCKAMQYLMLIEVIMSIQIKSIHSHVMSAIDAELFDDMLLILLICKKAYSGRLFEEHPNIYGLILYYAKHYGKAYVGGKQITSAEELLLALTN